MRDQWFTRSEAENNRAVDDWFRRFDPAYGAFPKTHRTKRSRLKCRQLPGSTTRRISRFGPARSCVQADTVFVSVR